MSVVVLAGRHGPRQQELSDPPVSAARTFEDFNHTFMVLQQFLAIKTADMCSFNREFAKYRCARPVLALKYWFMRHSKRYFFPGVRSLILCGYLTGYSLTSPIHSIAPRPQILSGGSDYASEFDRDKRDFLMHRREWTDDLRIGPRADRQHTA
jgi:hypothetical protein